MKKKSKLKGRILLLLKISFVFGLLYFLIKNGFISIQATQQALKEWQYVLPGFAAMAFAVILGVFRWQWLLKDQNISLSWFKTFQLTFIGTFFNIALPGAVSGDFVKAYYVGQATKGPKTKAFGSIVFDRLAGLSALVLVSALALAFGFVESNIDPTLLKAVQVTMSVAAACVVGFFGYLFLVKERHDPLLKMLTQVQKKLPVIASLVSIYQSVRHYHNHRWTVVKVLLISIIIHLFVGWGFLHYAHALNEVHLSLVAVYIVVPLGLLVTAIPIAPAGVGTGNLAFLYLFHLIGSERGADIYSLVALSNILIGCLGGLIYLRYKAHDSIPQAAFEAT